MKLVISKSILILTVSILSSATMLAAVIAIGSHSSGSAAYSGINAVYKYSSAEFIISANEIGRSGNIESLSLYKVSGASGTGIDSVHIYLKESDSTINSVVNVGDYTEVFSGVLPNDIATGWIKAELPTPFSYSKTKNLMVLIVRRNGTKLTGSIPNYAVSYSSEKRFSSAYFSSDTNPWTSSPLRSIQHKNQQYRPMLQIEFE